MHGYYRINMVDGMLSDFDYNRHPIDIKRNTLYTVNIYKASNYGYTTLTEAINNRASNIEYTVTAYVPSSEKYEDAHDIISNGDYFLGVSNSAFVSYSSGATGVIATTLTHNATATVTTAYISVSGTGLTLDAPSTGTFNPGDATKKLNIEVSMTSTFTTGTITIVLGNITKVITVEQRAPITFLSGVVDDFAIANEHFTGMLIPVSGVTPNWLKFSTAADGSNSVEEIANLAGKIYIVHDHNIVLSGGTTRSGSVYITRDDEKGRVKALFIQPYLNADGITDNMPAHVNTFVGAFWKANQTGERLIRIVRPTTSPVDAIDGQWTAVALIGNSFIKLDKQPSLDAGVWSPGGPAIDGNDLGFDALHSVMGTATSVFGTMGVSPLSQEIYFRIGLRSDFQPTLVDPVRYGMVLLAAKGGAVLQRIFIRQGEEADNVSEITAPTDYADVKWMPYNVGNFFNKTQYGNPYGLVAYPSQAGYLYQWENPLLNAFPPTGLISISSSVIGIPIENPCPAGYVLPSGELNGTSEIESLKTAWGTGAPTDIRLAWGYYADGFFDRRAPGTSEFGVAVSVVATGSDVAFMGQLVYNPSTIASLFIPSAGNRFPTEQDTYGGGETGRYWSRTLDINTGNATAFFLNTLRISNLVLNNSGTMNALSLRCVVERCVTLSTITISSSGSTTVPAGTTAATLSISSLNPLDANHLDFQWQRSLDGGITWVDIVGETGTSLVSTAVNAGITKYRITGTNGCSGLVTSNVIDITGTGSEPLPPPGVNVYVGAFWKNTQTGERLIRILRPVGTSDDAVIDGAWTATVISGNTWIVLDTQSSNDGNVWTDSPNVSGNDLTFETGSTYQVSGSTTTVSGVLNSGTPSIYFRIGLLSQNSGSNPRYGVVLLTYAGHSKSQRIFIRQGEGADYTPDLATGAQWSPYNVGNFISAGNQNNIVDYPTKIGYFYQWGYSVNSNTPVAYHPINPLGGISPWVVNSNAGFQYTLGTVCPAGYILPVESELVTFGSTTIIKGYYADGFFDRRELNATAYGTNGSINTAVSYFTPVSDVRNSDVAYIGTLFYGANTNASIFFPRGGIRDRLDGSLQHAGTTSIYWSRSVSSDPASADRMSLDGVGILSDHGYDNFTHARSIRCVVDPPFLSVNPTNLSFNNTANGGGPQTVSVSTNQPSWTVTSSQSWASVPGGAQTGTSFSVTITSANNTSTARTATLTVSAGGLTQYVYVTQSATITTVSPSSIALPAFMPATSVYMITVTSNGSWTLTSNDATWFRFSTAATTVFGSALGTISGTGNGTFYIIAVDNSVSSTKTGGTIYLNGVTTDIRVTVTQAGNPYSLCGGYYLAPTHYSATVKDVIEGAAFCPTDTRLPNSTAEVNALISGNCISNQTVLNYITFQQPYVSNRAWVYFWDGFNPTRSWQNLISGGEPYASTNYRCIYRQQ